jgi:5-methylcytosine-specific restriction endonuclease McrA
MTEIGNGESDLRLILSQGDCEEFRYLISLMSNQVPAGNLVEAFRHILDAARPVLEKRKFSATSQPRKSRRTSSDPHHIPAEVKREVWKRDGGRCAFVSDGGQRCPAKDQLEFDHVEEVARGGKSTVSNVRLLCRAHNQFHAEQTFGEDFMKTKRQRRQEEARSRKVAGGVDATPPDDSNEADVIACLRTLGYRDREARSAAAFSRSPSPTSIEDRVRRALAYFQPKGRMFSLAENAAQLAAMT